jgi:hypothetical protein
MLPILQACYNGLDKLETPISTEFTCLLIECFTPNTAKSLFSNSSQYQVLFMNLLSASSQPQAVIACKAALNMINKDFFSSISHDSQAVIISALLVLLPTTLVDVSNLIKTIIECLPISNALILKLFTQINKSISPELQVAKKIRAHENEEIEFFPRLLSLLEVIRSNSNIALEYSIIPCLFETLNSLLNLNANAPPRIEYAKQLTLKVILDVISNLKDTETKMIKEEALRMDLVVQCVRVTNNPQTHNAALLLLAATGSRYPHIVLLNIMPVFTFMGSSILRQDDDFSLHVIVKTLQTIIPSLLKNGDTVTQIVSIMKMFVDAVRHIPEFRQLKLFKVLLEILNFDSYLGNMISLLVTYTLSNTTFSVGDKFDYNKFALDLLHEYDGQVQLSTLNNMFQLLGSHGKEHDIFYSALFGDELDEKVSRKVYLRLVNFTLIALKSSSIIKAIHEVSMADSQLHMSLVENILSHIEIFANKGKNKYSRSNSNSNFSYPQFTL